MKITLYILSFVNLIVAGMALVGVVADESITIYSGVIVAIWGIYPILVLLHLDKSKEVF